MCGQGSDCSLPFNCYLRELVDRETPVDVERLGAELVDLLGDVLVGDELVERVTPVDVPPDELVELGVVVEPTLVERLTPLSLVRGIDL